MNSSNKKTYKDGKDAKPDRFMITDHRRKRNEQTSQRIGDNADDGA